MEEKVQVFRQNIFIWPQEGIAVSVMQDLS